jgi:E3 ubiquitin-protein ligase UBR1
LREVYKILKILRDKHPIFDFLPDDIFESEEFLKVFHTLLVKSTTIFLRKLSIFVLGKCADLRGTVLDDCIGDYQGLECDRLCDLLKLPRIHEMFSRFSDSESIEYQKFNNFLKFVQVTDYELNFDRLEYPGVIKLIDLPENLFDIFTKLLYHKKEFENKLKYGLDPAICLACGSVVHLQKQAPLKRSFKKLGECNYHLQNECLSQLGMFLLPLHNSMILLNKSGKGSFYAIPYADDHGSLEIDKNSRVLALDHDKYDLFIRNMWLNNDISNYITRKLEGVLDIGGWESF